MLVAASMRVVVAAGPPPSRQAGDTDTHAALFSETRFPSATTCARCHAEVYRESLVSHIFRTTPATIGGQRGPVATAS